MSCNLGGIETELSTRRFDCVCIRFQEYVKVDALALKVNTVHFVIRNYEIRNIGKVRDDFEAFLVEFVC